jgi:hypothetical protein
MLTVEVTLAGVAGGPAGSIVAVPPGGSGRRVTVALRPFRDLLATSAFLAGERPWVRARLQIPRGRWDLRWSSAGADVSLGSVTVDVGAGVRELRARRADMAEHLRAGRVREARRLALSLRLRSREDNGGPAREALVLYARHLADRALALGERAQLTVAAAMAREAMAFAEDDGAATATVRRLTERMADAARTRSRAGDPVTAFRLARDAVLIDPRRSWMRRLAEELRGRRRNDYDGGRDLAAYRTAAHALEGPGEVIPTDLDAAAVLLASCDRHAEAAALVDRVGLVPVYPRARLAAARGYLARAEITEVQRLGSTVPCSAARDLELALGFRALTGRALRPGDPMCEAAGPQPGDAPWVRAAAPFDVRDGSFEQANWGGWTVTGRAFGPRPIHDTPPAQTFINGWRGWRYANSYAGTSTDAATGLLRSRAFVVSEDGMSFLIAGGSDAERLGVRLKVDGQVVLRAAGNNTEGFRRIFWDVRPWRGRSAVIEIEDSATDAWGHVMVDDLLAEPVVPTH